MTIATSTLRPGLLVSLKTSMRGNVSYRVSTIESDRLTADGARRAVWETERTISDAAEHEAAGKARSKARSLVTAVCAGSAFGLLCPEGKAADLESALNEARRVVDAFNRVATLSRIGFYVIVGRVASDDVEAIRAINSEVRDLLAAMESGVRNLDVKAIRDAANKAKSLGQMLTPEAAARVQVAIDVARNAARQIKRVGEVASGEIDSQVLRQLAESRTAFLDLSESEDSAMADLPEAEREIDFAPLAQSAADTCEVSAAPVAAEIETAAPVAAPVAAIGIDFEPAGYVPAAAPVAAVPAFDFE